jgi:hypothetical protein
MPDLDLDRLAAMTVTELDDVYREASAPSLADLEGELRGRALAAVALDRGPVATALRALASSPQFPWAGKAFRAKGGEVGEGINRLRLLGKRKLFPFGTSLGESALDGLPCVVFDYDRPPNPWPVRQLRDELRQAAPGVFLGPALWKARPRPRLLFYFGLERR